MRVPVVHSINGLRNHRFNVWVFGSRRPTRVPLFTARHRAARLACAREHGDWKREAWSGESIFRLLNDDGSLRIWGEAHGSSMPG
ncbi:hypothetical protein TNCV_3353161 [Trichonephila clavipes]|nr:hypothetical protein TNCV_3353161 [Trichonephila clavipes]